MAEAYGSTESVSWVLSAMSLGALIKGEQLVDRDLARRGGVCFSGGGYLVLGAAVLEVSGRFAGGWVTGLDRIVTGT